MRKKLPAGDPMLFHKLDDAVCRLLQTEVLHAIAAEPETAVRRQICDTVSELAIAVCSTEQGWPELFQFLVSCVSAEAAQLRESGLFIFGNIATISSAILEDKADLVLQVCTKTLADPAANVRVMAMYAAASLITSLPEASQQRPFHTLMPAFLQLLNDLLRADEQEDAEKVLTSIVEVTEKVEHSFFRPYLDAYISAMLQIGQSRQLEEGLRKRALEFQVLVSEKASGLVRKSRVFIESVFTAAMVLMLDIDDDPKWETTAEPIDAVYEDTCFDTGCDALDRLAISIGHRKAMPVCFRLMQTFAQNADWHYRHAAMWTLSQVGEVMQEDDLDAQLENAVRFFADPHPRVRYAAVNAVGQLANDFAPNMQARLHSSLLPALVAMLSDSSQRVQAHAAAALINFCEHMAAEDLAPYIPNLLSALFGRLRDGARQVQEQVITAVAIVADSGKEHFKAFYGHFVPLLKQIIVQATGKDDRFFRGRAMECLTLIGTAVGAEMFAADAKELMGVLISLYASPEPQASEADDQFRSYALSAWSRCCTVLKTDFLPYMPAVMPVVLRAAALNPELEFLRGGGNDDDGSNDDEADLDEALDAAEGVKKWSMKTSVLEEKASACAMLVSFASDLEVHFFPWVEATAQVLLPCVTYTFNDEVRQHGSAAMPVLMNVAVAALKAGQTSIAFVQGMFRAQLVEVVNAFKIEDDFSVLVTLVQSLTSLIEEAKDFVSQLLDEEKLTIVGDACLKLLTNSTTRMLDRDKQKREDPEHDEEADETMQHENDADSELNFHLCAAFNALIKSQGANFLPVCPSLVPPMAQLVTSGNEEFEKIALYIFDDILEFCGPAAAAQYARDFVPQLTRCTLSDSVLVRQPACYGLGIAARHVDAALMAPFCNDAIKGLLAACARPDARDEINNPCTDNAISAIGKFIQYQGAGGSFDVNTLVGYFFSLLPLVEDYTEGPNCYGLLCSLVERCARVSLLSNLLVIQRFLCIL